MSTRTRGSRKPITEPEEDWKTRYETLARQLEVLATEALTRNNGRKMASQTQKVDAERALSETLVELCVLANTSTHGLDTREPE